MEGVHTYPVSVTEEGYIEDLVEGSGGSFPRYKVYGEGRDQK